MQDRFKFRVWCNREKCYLYNAEMNNAIVLTQLPDYKIAEQCTGLKDTNGKLIYEGDIVRVLEQFKTNTLDMNYPMLFNDKVAKFGFKHPDGHFFYFTNDEDYSYEVIGNIHETPDLLENKDE